MAKKVGGFAQKSARAREKRDYSLVKYIKSVRSEKTGFWRFQEQILQIKDGEGVKAALQRADAAAHPAPEQIPVIQPDETQADAPAKAEEKVAAVVEETQIEEQPEAVEEAVAEEVEPATAEVAEDPKAE